MLAKTMADLINISTLSKMLKSFIGSIVWMLAKVSSVWRSPTHEFVYILHICYQVADRDNHLQSVRTAFIDFAKAFGHVNHSTALNKMIAIGVRATIWRRDGFWRPGARGSGGAPLAPPAGSGAEPQQLGVRG
jgi:hypothetical protein